MKASQATQRGLRSARWWSAAVLALALTACGGGGGDATEDSQKAYSFSGTVTAIEGQGNFRVDNIPVAAAQLPAGMQVGSRVEVEGVLDPNNTTARKQSASSFTNSIHPSPSPFPRPLHLHFPHTNGKTPSDTYLYICIKKYIHSIKCTKAHPSATSPLIDIAPLICTVQYGDIGAKKSA
jgi:hypothetical protein